MTPQWDSEKPIYLQLYQQLNVTMMFWARWFEICGGRIGTMFHQGCSSLQLGFQATVMHTSMHAWKGLGIFREYHPWVSSSVCMSLKHTCRSRIFTSDTTWDTILRASACFPSVIVFALNCFPAVFENCGMVLCLGTRAHALMHVSCTNTCKPSFAGSRHPHRGEPCPLWYSLWTLFALFSSTAAPFLVRLSPP